MEATYTVLNLEERRQAGEKWLFGPYPERDPNQYTEALEIGYVNLQEVEKTDKLHFHARIEEYYVVLSGHLRIQVNQEIIDVPEGSIFLVRPGNPHLILQVKPTTKLVLIKAPAVLGDKLLVSD